jgi:recombination protein U
MVNYPDGRKHNWAGNVTSAARRGMDLEKDMNTTNSYYLSEDKAVIHKKPTPVQIVKTDYPKRSAARITEAYFKIPSTTDYNGIYRGKYIDFEAKDCMSKTSFPMKSIHAHQITHLEAIRRHGGIAFLIIRFREFNEVYLVTIEAVKNYTDEHTRHSIPYEWFHDHATLIPESYLKPVDYLQVVDELYFRSNSEGGSQSNVK